MTPEDIYRYRSPSNFSIMPKPTVAVPGSIPNIRWPDKRYPSNNSQPQRAQDRVTLSRIESSREVYSKQVVRQTTELFGRPTALQRLAVTYKMPMAFFSAACLDCRARASKSGG